MDVLSKLLVSVGGRKFFLAFTTEFGLMMLKWFDHLGDDPFQWVTLGVVGAYITGDLVEKIKTPNPPKLQEPNGNP